MPAPESVDLDAVRTALGPFPEAGIELVGRAEFQGTQAELLWQIAADGRFRREIRGPLTKISGFDGTTFWQMDEAGESYELQLFSREHALAETALVSGLWCDPAGAFECSAVADGIVELRSKEGRLRGRVEIDPGTSRPAAWRVDDLGAGAGLEFGDWRSASGRSIAREIAVPTSSGLRNSYSIDAVKPLGSADFSRPPRLARSGALDPDLPAEVALLRAPSGHLLVRARLQGEDVGWFVFDTGAALSVIVPEVADRLALRVIGRSTLVGAGAEVSQTRLRVSGRLELGPLEIEELVWSEMPPGSGLEALADLVEGEVLVGILGFDVLIRCLVELDLVAGTLALRDPQRYELPADGHWEPLLLHRKHPFLQGRYPGGHQGWFCIDSGAGVMPLTFHSPAVQAHGLLEGVEAEELEALGAGGVLRLKVAEIDWFEIAGRRHERPTVLFSQESAGAFADPWSTGTLGHPFFEGLTLVFDYAGGRVGIFPTR